MTTLTPEQEQRIIEKAVACQLKPVDWVTFVFDWGFDWLKGKFIRTWQLRILQDIQDKLADPETRYMPIQIAVASGHGIGKSALISMLSNYVMSCFLDARVVVTANTETQLRTKTWPEICKWFRSGINAHWFKLNSLSIFSISKGHEKSWRADAVSWSKDNTEAFAGLHNEGKAILVVYDEASAIHDKVWEVTEGALTDEKTVIIWVAFGNPTRNTGRFRECFRKFKKRWLTYQIDSRTVEGTNKKKLDEWIEDHGEDSDFAKIRIRGIFPNMSARQFISESDVDRAYGRHLREDQYRFAPTILTCDPAWTGEDDLVMAVRQGLMFKVLEVIPKNDDDLLIAQKLAAYEDEYKADAVFIDQGYGTGIYSIGKAMGRVWQLVAFGGKASKKGYFNKRDEMWKEMKAWIKAGGAIPEDPILRDELLGVETIPTLDGTIRLESKEDMKKKNLPSPNRADALALSFAFPVTVKTHHSSTETQNAISDYEPF